MLSPTLIQRRLNLILAQVLLKFELVLQRDLSKLDQPAISPPFLAGICLEEETSDQKRTREGTREGTPEGTREGTPEGTQEHNQEHNQLQENQPETINSNVEITQALTSTPTASPPTSPQSSQTTTIIQTHPEEPSPINADHQVQKFELQQKQQHVQPKQPQCQQSLKQQQPPKNKNSSNHETGPPNAPNPPPSKFNEPGTTHQDPNQNNASHANPNLPKRLRDVEGLPRMGKRASKRRRKQQQIMNQSKARERRLSLNSEQRSGNYNSENRPEYTNDIEMSVPNNEEPAIRPVTVMGDMIRWGDTIPAGYPSTYQPPPPQPRYYDPPPHQLHLFSNSQPYTTGPNGYIQYSNLPHQYVSYPPEAYFTYPPSSEPSPSNPYPTDSVVDPHFSNDFTHLPPHYYPY